MFAEVPNFKYWVCFVWCLAMASLILHYTPFQTEAGSGYCLWEYRLGAFILKKVRLYASAWHTYR